jgi:hypothetical protein
MTVAAKPLFFTQPSALSPQPSALSPQFLLLLIGAMMNMMNHIGRTIAKVVFYRFATVLVFWISVGCVYSRPLYARGRFCFICHILPYFSSRLPDEAVYLNDRM